MPEYIIQPGDTLANIADYYDVSVEAIIAENPHLNPENLSPGTSIVIPVSMDRRILRRMLGVE